MDKKRPLVQRILIIFLLLFISQTSDAKSTNKNKFIKEYEEITKSIKENNNKRTKQTYEQFSKLKKKYDLDKVSSKKLTAYISFYICEGAYRYDSSDLELAASKCKEADTLYRKAGLYNKPKSSEKYI